MRTHLDPLTQQGGLSFPRIHRPGLRVICGVAVLFNELPRFLELPHQHTQHNGAGVEDLPDSNELPGGPAPSAA